MERSRNSMGFKMNPCVVTGSSCPTNETDLVVRERLEGFTNRNIFMSNAFYLFKVFTILATLFILFDTTLMLL